MGGGDLNLKKSWHPHTMKNQERVWKAEQAKTQETKKVNDLRKEIEEEKNREELKRIGMASGVLGSSNMSDKKLDWMYKSSTELINREEYLLGRKIDKSFEILQAEEKEKRNLVGVKQPLNHVEHECVPFSIRAYKNLDSSEQVDLQRKVMEDPLMLIKQREIESRRKILENPVKLKELHRILKTDEKLHLQSKSKSKKIKKSKKSKKEHKKSIKSSSSSNRSSVCESDSDLDLKLAKKLKSSILNKDDASTLNLNLTKLLDSKFEKISKELDKAVGKSKKRSKKNTLKSADSGTNYRSDQKRNYMSRRSRSLSEHRQITNKDRRSDSVSRNRKNYEHSRLISSPKRNVLDIRHNRSFRSTSSSKDNINIMLRSTSRDRNKKVSVSKISTMRDMRYDRSRSNSRRRKISRRSRSKSTRDQIQNTEKTNFSFGQRSSKLTDEEKQAKLKEMMTNAAWREDERAEVVRKHRENYAKEEKHHTEREFDKSFLNKEVKKAISNQTSVGSRIRANLNNIQRTSAAMNLNFVRK